MNSAEDDILDVSHHLFTGDFNVQVEALLARVRLTRTEVENLRCLLDDLERIFSYNWPGSEVQPFGSIVTGLGIKTSDIDCYVQLPRGNNIHNPVRRAQEMLKRNGRLFSQVFAITTAKIPIVKFQHNPTRFHCDVNFSSSNGVHNSKLVAYLLNMDPRALPLAILIKYWSKVFNFTGTNLMPNYALTMMVISYLQFKLILPSVEELQRDVECHWVDCWNTAFNNSYAYKCCNEESLYYLLGGFFDYYSDFDYAQNVISPFLGHPVKKQNLEDINSVPGPYGLYKENVEKHYCKPITLKTVICIQDPFEHGRNCTVAVYPKLFSKIQALIVLASKMFYESSPDEFLEKIFTLNVPTVTTTNKKHKSKLKNNINKRIKNMRNEKAKALYTQWKLTKDSQKQIPPNDTTKS